MDVLCVLVGEYWVLLCLQSCQSRKNKLSTRICQLVCVCVCVFWRRGSCSGVGLIMKTTVCEFDLCSETTIQRVFNGRTDAQGGAQVIACPLEMHSLVIKDQPVCVCWSAEWHAIAFWRKISFSCFSLLLNCSTENFAGLCWASGNSLFVYGNMICVCALLIPQVPIL